MSCCIGGVCTTPACKATNCASCPDKANNQAPVANQNPGNAQQAQQPIDLAGALKLLLTQVLGGAQTA